MFTGDNFLILTGVSQRLETLSSSDRNVTVQNVQLSQTKAPLTAAGGELRGVLDGRDTIIGGFIDQFDTFTSSLIFEFNRIHSSGEGLKGFTSVSALSSVSDTTAALNATAAGLKFTPTHGSFQVKLTNTLSGLTETTNIQIDLDGIDPGNDTTLTSLRTSLDNVNNLTATISTDGRLQLTATAGFEIRFAADTSGTLATLGINTFFTGSDSDDIGVNSLVAGDQSFFATAQGGGAGDGRNAILLAGFVDNPITALSNQSLDDFYNTTISALAQSAASESSVAQGFTAFRDSLLNQREQTSGVSLDEEAINIIEFQRSFQAAAKLISVIDELLTTLLNI